MTELRLGRPASRIIDHAKAGERTQKDCASLYCTTFASPGRKLELHASQQHSAIKDMETATEGTIAQLRVTNGGGSDYLLPFPCKLTKDGWVNAASNKPLAVRPTYWKPYVETTPRRSGFTKVRP